MSPISLPVALRLFYITNPKNVNPNVTILKLRVRATCTFFFFFLISIAFPDYSSDIFVLYYLLVNSLFSKF